MKNPNSRKRDAVVEATAHCFEFNLACLRQVEQELSSGKDITLHNNYAKLMQQIQGGAILDGHAALSVLGSGVIDHVINLDYSPEQSDVNSDVSELCKSFAQVYRAPEYGYTGIKEDDAVHSALLALQLGTLVLQYGEWMPAEFDVGKLVLYAAVHDLDEVISGDIRTLGLSYEEIKSKSAQSANALEEFIERYRELNKIVEALSVYSKQLDDEAQIVKIHDKACPTMTHCTNAGKVLKEEYGMKNPIDYITSIEGTSRKIFKHPYSNHPFWLSILCESRARAMQDTFGISIGEARIISIKYARIYGLDISEDWLVL